jgi:hypothetical protein
MRVILRRFAFVTLALLVPLAAVGQPASKGKTEAPPQPGLLALAQPRLTELREAGITQIVGRAASRNNIQVLTRYGPAYMRWPRGTAPRAFELYLNADGSNAAFASGYAEQDKAAWAAMLDAVFAQALKEAAQVRANATRIKP